MQLNLISDEGAENIREIYAEWLKENLGGWPGYEAHLNLGLLAWRSGKIEKMKKHLFQAAEIVVEVLAKRDLSGTDKRRQPSDVVLPFMLAFIFGDRSMQIKLAKLPRQSWFFPEEEEYQPLGDLLDVLRNYAVEQMPDKKKIVSILKRNQHPGANWYYRPWVQAMGEGLLAIMERKLFHLEKTVLELLNYHMEEALEGEWQYLVEGLMATWATVLLIIAKNAGIIVKIDSPYVVPRS